MKTVVFTDLDATLLDPYTYSWAAATDAIEALRELEASIILVSSKTLSEMQPLHSELGLEDPFIVENGGGIVFMSETPLAHELLALIKETDLVSDGNLFVIPFGVRHEALVKALAEISTEIGIPLRGFSSMSIKEISSLTGLEIQRAEMAAVRHFDEPFILERQSAIPEIVIEEAARQRGFTAVQGGRFWHLMGHSGKGHAVSLLIEAFRRLHGEVITIGLGDSPNDYPFLELVDIPILLGGAAQELYLPDSLLRAQLTFECGPEGWNGAILACLSKE